MIKDKCHFIGIGGIGMSGLARILLKKGVLVSGSDVATNAHTQNLVSEGADVSIGHSANHIHEEMTVVYSSSIRDSNPEFQAAKNLKCSLIHRSDLLLKLMLHQKSLAVTGTHGKTTTSALLTSVLVAAGKDPSYAVGGIISHLQSNAGHGTGEFFVAEADESDGTFLKYSPDGAIVTNIGNDHLDHFGSEANIMESYQLFLSKTKDKELLFWCGDCPALRSLKSPGTSYGFEPTNTLRIENFRQRGWSSTFDVVVEEKKYSLIELALPGKHNALNALGVFGLALKLGIDEQAIRNAFKNFQGVGRRCEKKGECHGILVLDDYAHHPTEIAATLHAIRDATPERRLIAIFQPHRYTRTRDCLGQYAEIFQDADETIVTDIYSAGEQPIPGLSHEDVMAEVKAHCTYVPRADLAKILASKVRPHDVVVTLGAGDITRMGTDLLDLLHKNQPEKIRVGLVYGGRSVEHEVALASSQNIANNLNHSLYQVQEFGITKEGAWITGPDTRQKLEEGQDTSSSPFLDSHVLKELLNCDVLFPVLHGPYGEDGTIQGFFEMLGKAYVGCDYRASAVCMDKVLTKKLLVYHDIPTAPFFGFTHHQWRQSSKSILRKILSLNFPVFIKGAHLGSSVGVYKVQEEMELAEAIIEAFRFDNLLLAEQGIRGREIEFAVLGNDEVHAFPPGEVLTYGQVYDYEAKYGPNGMSTDVQAKLTPEQQQTGQELAKQAYLAAGCQGMTRIDFFLDENGQFWCNELNPIPGFTAISLYPKICEANGLPLPKLLDQLIGLALRRHAKHIKVNSNR